MERRDNKPMLAELKGGGMVDSGKGLDTKIGAFISNELAHIEHHAETLRLFGVSFVNQLLTIHVAGLVAAIGMAPTDVGSKIVSANANLYLALVIVLAIGAVASFCVKVFIFSLSFAKLRAYREYLANTVKNGNYDEVDWTNGPTRDNGKLAEFFAAISFAVAALCMVSAIVMFTLLVHQVP